MSEIDFSKYPSVSFRPGETLDKALSERVGESKNWVAKRDLQRYYDLLESSLPTFTEAESLRLCDVLNGVMCSPSTLYGNIAAALHGKRADASFDRAAFLARINSLSMLECQAVIDAVERFWAGPGYYKSPEESKAALYRVGLVR